MNHQEIREKLRQTVDAHGGQLGLSTSSAETVRTTAQRRRGLRTRPSQPALYLCSSNGVLYWDTRAARVAPGLRRGARRGIIPADFIDKIVAAPLEANMVASFLRDLDSLWNPAPGLKRWTGRQLAPIEASDVAKRGKILLIIHGTFSNADAIVSPLAAGGLLRDAARKYDQILAFDHPSVSVSPVMNALDLSRVMAGTSAQIDVITHSRGGLVTRWWLETLHPPSRAHRAMLVASPMNGTSLATPRSIRSLMSWLSNISNAIGELSGVAAPMIPFLSVVMGLARLAGGLTAVASKAPIADAAMSMVPGLSAMSRESFELVRSQYDGAVRPEYYGITSDFEPNAIGWEFWKAFQGAATRVANAFVDPLFDQANDLVVDTHSMDFLTTADRIPKSRVYSFGRNGTVHHTNYFDQPETLKFIRTKFQI